MSEDAKGPPDGPAGATVGEVKGRRIVRVADPAQAFRVAADRVIAWGSEALARSGIFRIALAGGSTPRGLYGELARRPQALDWSRVEFFFGDERTVPPGHADSNYRMAREALLEPLNVASARVFRMRGELEPTEAAAEYEGQLRAVFGTDPRFDLVLLGMGDDGHTASLFPHSPALSERVRWVAANPVAKLDTTRLTLTYPVLNRARAVLFLVTGAGKVPALSAVLEGPDDFAQYPSQGVRPEDGVLVWLVDEAAAAGLKSIQEGNRT